MKRQLTLIIIPLIFMFILLFISLAVLRHSAGIQPVLTLSEAFKNSGAEIVSSEITIQGSGKDILKTSGEINNFCLDISRVMGSNSDFRPEVINNENFKGIELNTNGSHFNYSVKVLKSKMESDGGRCYVTVYIIDGSITSALSNTSVIKSKVTDIFRQYGINTKTNICFTGRYTGRLENSEMNGICEGIFEKTGAHKVSGIRDNNLISVSAYSGSMEKSVVVDGREVNLNFAARYNSYENKTYIWLATPLITTEY